MKHLVLYQNYFLRTKPLHIPQNLGNQIVLKELNIKFQQSLEIYFCLNLCNTNAIMKARSLIIEMCNINI